MDETGLYVIVDMSRILWIDIILAYSLNKDRKNLNISNRTLSNRTETYRIATAWFILLPLIHYQK